MILKSHFKYLIFASLTALSVNVLAENGSLKIESGCNPTTQSLSIKGDSDQVLSYGKGTPLIESKSLTVVCEESNETGELPDSKPWVIDIMCEEDRYIKSITWRNDYKVSYKCELSVQTLENAQKDEKKDMNKQNEGD